MFEIFDPNLDFSIRRGANLPHWFQPGVTYFVTYRTDDSVPDALLQNWHRKRNDWLFRHGIDPKEPNWKMKLRQRPQLDAEFQLQFGREFEEYLDRGCGECLLKNPALSKIVAATLEHFDGERYHLGDFVVMPNHVHVIVCLLVDTEIQSLCESWKRYSAVKINQAIGRSGRFWQAESFDHLVRSSEQFEYLERYIAENGPNAGVKAGEYLHRPRKKRG